MVEGTVLESGMRRVGHEIYEGIYGIVRWRKEALV